MLTVIAARILASCLAGDPFSDLEHDAALAQATKAQKLLIIDFTASWCGPCQKMEKDTWPNADVRSWLAENAITIQIDVDEHQEVAQRYEIQSIPAIVALRDGKEFDRSVGYRDAAAFLAWAKAVRAGKSSKDALIDRSKALLDSKDVQQRYALAQELQRARCFDESLAHYLWLWSATRGDAEMADVRESFMLADMAQLAQQHAPAKAALLALLDEAAARLQNPGQTGELPDREAWSEFMSLCQYLRQQQRVVGWYEARRDAEGRLYADKHDHPTQQEIVADVYDALMTEDRPVDAVRLIGDARAYAERVVQQHRATQGNLDGMDADQRDQMELFGNGQLTSDLARLYGALLAADRREEAADVAKQLLETLDVPESRIALVRAGLEHAKTPEEQFTRWLDEAEAAGASVRLVRKRLVKRQAAAGAGD